MILVLAVALLIVVAGAVGYVFLRLRKSEARLDKVERDVLGQITGDDVERLSRHVVAEALEQALEVEAQAQAQAQAQTQVQ